jgi:hypothetical protein
MIVKLLGKDSMGRVNDCTDMGLGADLTCEFRKQTHGPDAL